MKHPGALALGGIDSVAYSYDATTGLLGSVRDPYADRFSFTYDAALRLASDNAVMADGTTLLTTRSYDNDSRMIGRTETQNGAVIVQDALTFDVRNKQITASFRMPDGTTQTDNNGFAKLGSMTNNEMLAVWWDDYVVDPLGHQRSRTANYQPVSTTTSTYDAGGSAELKMVVRAPQTILRDTTTNQYDAAGALWNVTVLRQIGTNDPPGHQYSWFARQRVLNRYGSNLQLMASETAFDTIDANQRLYDPQYYEHEEYRYDALGRRIWRRLIRPVTNCPLMNKSSGCLSVVERTVWDGDQVLWEVRADGGDGATASAMEADGGGVFVKAKLEGRVMYTHGAGIDHPLSIGRLDSQAGVIVPQYDWRGNAVSGYCTVATVCTTQLAWPEKLQSPWAEDPSPTDTVYWAGNLIGTQKDGSGYIFKLNRYHVRRAAGSRRKTPSGSRVG